MVVVVLNGLQAAVAVSALLVQAGVIGEQKAPSWYSAYAEQYAQAAQYYGQYGQQAPADPGYRSETAQAQQTQQVAAPQPQQAAAAQQAAPSPYGSYAEYVSGYGSDQAGASGHPSAPPQGAYPGQQSAPQAGLPNVGHAQGSAARQHAGSVEPEYRPSSQ